MPTLHIEHPTPDFDSWKRAFDSDPADPQRSGVRRYRVSRAVDDPNYVMIDLEFDRRERAEGLSGVDLEQAVTIYSRRSQDVAAPEWTCADVTPPTRFRLCRATASAMFILVGGDRRVEVTLDALVESFYSS